MEVVTLGEAHRSALNGFTCSRGSGRPWAQQAEQLVHALPIQLSHPDNRTEAIGLVDARGVLHGVAAWTPLRDDPEVWRSNLLAVRSGSQQHGHGCALKREVLRRAATSGVKVVLSVIHRDNDAMLAVNTRLGAEIIDDPGDLDFVLCTIIVA